MRCGPQYLTAKSDPAAIWWLYFIACSNHRIYVGISPNPLRRYRVHCAKRSAHMRMNTPQQLLGAIPVGCYADALRVERRVKQLPHELKLLEARRAGTSACWREVLSSHPEDIGHAD